MKLVHKFEEEEEDTLVQSRRLSVITIASPELLFFCPWPKQLLKKKKKSKSVVRLLVVLRAAHTDCFLDQGRELKEWKSTTTTSSSLLEWLQRKNQQPCLEEHEGGREQKKN